MSKLSVDVLSCVLRMTCRSFAESIFIYLLLNSSQINMPQSFISINKKKMFLFSFVYSFISVFLVAFCETADLYRLVSAVVVFFYFWHRQQKIHKNLIINYTAARDVKYALTTAIILISAVFSFNVISHMLLHTYCVLAGIYDVIRKDFILYELYKFAIMFLEIFFIFLTYKFRFIKMKDVKTMSTYKQVPITLGFCFLSMVYIGYAYDYMLPMVIASYRDTLLWAMAFILPSYIGFYLTTTHLTRLLSIKENHIANKSIRIWILNPSLIEITHLNIYDSDAFMTKFESKRFEFERMLEKLGINDEHKGYSELVFCLFLTRLFIGLKGWRFEREVFGQASLVIDVPIPKLQEDIENIIEQVWSTNEAETLIDGYYRPYQNINTYDQGQRPTATEFLMNIAKSV